MYKLDVHKKWFPNLKRILLTFFNIKGGNIIPKKRWKCKKNKKEDPKGLRKNYKKNNYGVTDLTAYNANEHLSKGGNIKDIIVYK